MNQIDIPNCRQPVSTLNNQDEEISGVFSLTQRVRRPIRIRDWHIKDAWSQSGFSRGFGERSFGEELRARRNQKELSDAQERKISRANPMKWDLSEDKRFPERVPQLSRKKPNFNETAACWTKYTDRAFLGATTNDILKQITRGTQGKVNVSKRMKVFAKRFRRSNRIEVKPASGIMAFETSSYMSSVIPDSSYDRYSISSRSTSRTSLS